MRNGVTYDCCSKVEHGKKGLRITWPSHRKLRGVKARALCLYSREAKMRFCGIGLRSNSVVVVTDEMDKILASRR